ncbi:DNA recombination protein RmuC [candidate division WOR-3 bacterium]|nr:DNA recombination protein RmuC [candidate division WOR-3 bacterium]
MDTAGYLLLSGLGVLLLLVVILLAVLLRRAPRGADPTGLALLQQQLDSLREQTARSLGDNTTALNQRLAELDRQMGRNSEAISTRLESAGRTVENVRQSLGELSQATERIHDVGRNIASLQDILRTPKLRGIIGEYFLGDLLRQVVPNHHELQYRFRSGEAVDAVVRLGGRLAPIDAKFPLEDFQRLTAETDDAARVRLRRAFVAALRKHVDAVASKYILPDEGTFDFALLYIPAENVYYETIIRAAPGEDSASDYALARKVIPVSPNTLYAYLQAIVLGLRGFRIEQRAEEILRHIGRLQHEHGRFREEFETLGRHLGNARNKYDDAAKRLDRFQEKLALDSEPDERPQAAD